ncbi:MAG TPA: sigma 54-interacting transcriptional regulator [Bacillota bacterium]|nr:sigma 54-interacting transcriptional regulator [Bacillota bacterium]
MITDKIGADGCISLLLDKQLFIRAITGTSTTLFKEGQSFQDVDWLSYFIAAPKNRKESQVIVSQHGQKFFYVWNEFRDLADDLAYMVVLLDVSYLPLNPATLSESHFPTSHLLIMESPSMQRILKIIQAISNVDSTVLLLGESGVGKSVIAEMIHQISNRSQNRFVSVNCGALPENLIEAELFGYEHGTFTGGRKGGATGLFEVAHGGTIFLDEIAELPYNLQAKLLNVLQEHTIRKVGSTESKKIHVRVIAATNKPLLQLVKEKKFREDLYYRLNVVPLTIPSLRERKEDIPYLMECFLSKYNKKYGRFKQLHPMVQHEFMEYYWPGNIRELENAIERLVVTDSHDMLDKILPMQDEQREVEYHERVEFMPLKKAKKKIEKELILKAYQVYGNTYKVAEVLEVDQSTIVKKMKEYRKDL